MQYKVFTEKPIRSYRTSNDLSYDIFLENSKDIIIVNNQWEAEYFIYCNTFSWIYSPGEEPTWIDIHWIDFFLYKSTKTNYSNAELENIKHMLYSNDNESKVLGTDLLYMLDIINNKDFFEKCIDHTSLSNEKTYVLYSVYYYLRGQKQWI